MVTSPLGTSYQRTPNGGADTDCWLLVLQYWHKGGTNPGLKLRDWADGFPVLAPSYSLGTDGSLDQSTWGHLTPAAMTTLKYAMPYTTLRFYAKSVGSGKVIHFKSSDPEMLAYFRTGSGNYACFSGQACPLPWTSQLQYKQYEEGESKHTAVQVPQAVYDGRSSQGDLAMTEFPFFVPWQAHWSVKGHDSSW
jgi:hypothetical protein